MEQIENTFLDFEFSSGGVTPIELGHDTGLRRFPFHVLVCNVGMISRVERENRVVTVNDGESYLIRKNETHRLLTRAGEHPVSVWCHFWITLLHSMDFFDFFELPEKFNPAESERIREACRTLVTGERESVFQQILFRKSAGLRLVEAITRACSERVNASENLEHLQRLVPAIDFMSRNLSGKWRLKEAAAHVNLSESRFTVLFKQTMACSPGIYWQQLRLRRAHELLSTGLTPTETAAQLGFYDVFHFSRSFKHNFGMTPAEYLRRRRKHIQMF